MLCDDDPLVSAEDRSMLRRTTLAAFALASLFASTSVHAQTPSPISPAELSATVKVLASDDFQGRAPGTPGEAKTVAYLIARFKALGLQPGGEAGSWTQPVPLVRTQVGPSPKLVVDTKAGALPLTQSEGVYVSTLHPVDRVSIDKAPMVFVGYGVSAPERQWDDFKGVDLKGKIAVFLVNDPDFEALPGEPVAGRFGGKAMTYYGRWTYKYEEAARRGAIGALIVHETPGAGYGWSTVTAPQGEAYDIKRPADGPQPILLQGWLQRDTAVDLFRKAGLDFEALKLKARRADFHPVALNGETFSADFPVTHSALESHNVLAKLPGTKRPDQTLIYAAHWDAYGIGKPDAKGDTIRHGANDDGLGVAGVLEIARAFKAAPPPRAHRGVRRLDRRGARPFGIGNLCGAPNLPLRQDGGQLHHGHPGDRRTLPRRGADRRGAGQPGGRFPHRRRQPGPLGEPGPPSGKGPVLPGRPLLPGQARRAHPAADGHRRRARSGGRRPGGGGQVGR